MNVDLFSKPKASPNNEDAGASANATTRGTDWLRTHICSITGRIGRHALVAAAVAVLVAAGVVAAATARSGRNAVPESNAGVSAINSDVPGGGLGLGAPATWSAPPSTRASGHGKPGVHRDDQKTGVTPTPTVGRLAGQPQGTTSKGTATASSAAPSHRSATRLPPSSTSASDSAYDNDGISSNSDGASAPGAFDDGNETLSAQALAADGFASGRPVTVHGITFTWPDADAPDNIVCSGQTVDIGGVGRTLGILGAANNGKATGSGVITYTDGTTQSFKLSLGDWRGSAATGTSIAATMSYVNNVSGRQNNSANVYYAGITLESGRTVKDVTLPDFSAVHFPKGSTALHVFAMAIAGG